MSQTLGQHLFDDAIPAEYRPPGTYTKGALYKSMLQMAKDDPALYATTIVKVKNLGDTFATMEGISVGLDDIAPIYKERNAIMAPALKKMQAATSRTERQAIVSQTQARMVDYAKTHPGTMGDMARSGGRGNMVQLMKAVGSPVAANDEHDKVQPWLITKSYSEGLSPSEWWVANREARMAAAKSTIEVSEPGDVSKIIINNVQDQVITKQDCGTHNGVRLSVDSPEIRDRYRASDSKLITKTVAAEIRKKDPGGYVLVRSPMTCEAPHGVCQLCMGNTVTGKLNAIGDNVGIRAAHAMGEPLTQLALNAKHGVRTAGGSAGVSGLEGFRAIIETPASFKNKATLAPNDGSVASIVSAPQGGHYVTVGGTRAHVAPGLRVTVRVGDQVHAGDVLSEGTPRPDEVVHHKGLGAGREYIIGQLGTIYRDAGIDVDRRHLEILAKGALNHVTVDHIEDNDHGIIRGDTINFNQLQKLVGDRHETVDLGAAAGKYLAVAVQEHLPGTKITPGLISELRRKGVLKVAVSNVHAAVTPFMAPATRNPLLNPDWLVRMGHRNLRQSLVEGAAMGHSTDFSSTAPVPAMIFNTHFGEGADGRY